MRSAPGKIDLPAVLAGVGGNRHVLQEIIRIFLADYLLRLTEIKEALRRGDPMALSRAAHTLKGSIGNLAAKDAFASAQRLEILANMATLLLPRVQLRCWNPNWLL